ncbi:hypothetical protein [Nitratifractor sp.]
MPLRIVQARLIGFFQPFQRQIIDYTIEASTSPKFAHTALDCIIRINMMGRVVFIRVLWGIVGCWRHYMRTMTDFLLRFRLPWRKVHACCVSMEGGDDFPVLSSFSNLDGGGEMSDFGTMVKSADGMALEVFRDYLICRIT